MKIVVNCTGIDPRKTLAVLNFGMRLSKAIQSVSNEKVDGLVEKKWKDSAVFNGAFDNLKSINTEEYNETDYDIELMLHHFQFPCTNASKVMIFHDVHLWDVPWKYPDRIKRVQDLLSVTNTVDAIIVHFPRTYYDLPKVIPDISNRIFLTFLPAHIDYVEKDTSIIKKIKKEFSISESDKVLLFPAQLQPHKNHLNLFRAMLLLRGHPIKLICTGSQLQKDHATLLKQYIAELQLADKIMLTGKIDDKKLQQIFHLADLVVFPGFAEDGAPIAQEAIVYGKDIIYSDLKPVRQHLEKMNAKIPLFDPLDPKAMAKTILEALDNKQDHSKAKAKIDSWTFEKLAELYFKIFVWLASGKPTGEMPLFLDDDLGYIVYK